MDAVAKLTRSGAAFFAILAPSGVFVFTIRGNLKVRDRDAGRPCVFQTANERNYSMALTISGLSKTYPNGVCALNNLSLTMGNNMFGLLGPNGAGRVV